MAETYQTDISLYGKVMKALESSHGKLPDAFILNESNCKNGVVFSEGNLDQLFSHHKGNISPDPFERILEQACMNPATACSQSNEFFSGKPMRYVLVQKVLREWRHEHHALIQSTGVVSFLKQRIRETVNVEELKFLLDTCGELDTYDEDMQRMIRNLSQCSEIAAFCYPSLQKFPNGNELIFRIARNVEGQAKAEAIYALNPDNEEKKRWMIYEGRPKFLGWYSTGAVIAGKCDFAKLLKKPDLLLEDRDQIGEITSTFLEEGPSIGLKDLPDWEGLCRTYIHMVRENPTVRGICNISHEYECLESERDRNVPAIEHLIKECEKTLNDEEILSFARERIEKGEDLILAELLSVPYEEDVIFEALKRNFEKNYRNVIYLKEPKHIKEAFETLFDAVDFSTAETSDNSDQTADMVFDFVSCMRPEFMNQDAEETFIRKCNEMIEFGLRCRQYAGLYERTLEAVEFLQNNGIVFNDHITAYMNEIYRKREEAEKKSEIRRMLRKKIREEEKKKQEEMKMRS